MAIFVIIIIGGALQKEMKGDKAHKLYIHLDIQLKQLEIKPT